MTTIAMMAIWPTDQIMRRRKRRSIGSIGLETSMRMRVVGMRLGGIIVGDFEARMLDR
jgi:hypothetical protein